MATYGTPLRATMPAGRTSFVPGEAWAMRPTTHNTVFLRLLLQVIDTLAVSPLAQALVMVTATRLAPDTVRIAYKYRPNFMGFAEIHRLAGALLAGRAPAVHGAG